MINEGIQQGKYKETDDNILKELESFQSFLYRHFKNSPHYRQVIYLFILYLLLTILQLKISVAQNTQKTNSYILDIY